MNPFLWFKRRPSWVYVAMTHHPFKCDHIASKCVPVVGYVGETCRKPEVRWKEHEHGSARYGIPAKPWADTIIEWKIVWRRRRCTDFRRKWAETRYIHKLRPLYNYKCNQLNTRRITIADQRYQRSVRDAGLVPTVTRNVNYHRDAIAGWHRDGDKVRWYGASAKQFM